MTRVAVAIALLIGATPLFAQSDWSAVRPNPMVTLELRQLVGLLMIVPAVTLFLLYIFRPRAYVLAGAASWAAGAVMLLILSFDTGAPNSADGAARISAGRLAVAIWAIAAVCFGAGVRLAARWFHAASSVTRRVVWTAGLTIAYTIAAAAYLRPAAVILPAFIVMSAFHVRGAVDYLQIARRHRMVGPLLTGLGAAGIVAVNVTALLVAAVTGGIGAASTRVAYFNFIFAALLIVGMHLLVFEDVIHELRNAAGELSKSRDEMKAMAVTDPLTKCYNRRFLDEIAEHELEQHRRYKLPLSLLYIDIDHFKAINDQLGHQTGDEVLVTLGQILNELTRQADYVLRWGGDEFLVLLSASEAEAQNKANQVRRAFLESAIVKNLPDGVDVSVGVVAVPPETKDFDPLIDQADREMYRRKRALAS
ncbi:MAG TPA: GGDEF domain-containing protein [Vicinamibacterales bacterium]|nr:GGDEF domain-containing protein [Vicinamibacterales bacterium]